MFRNDICNKESHSRKVNQDEAHFCYELPSKMNPLYFLGRFLTPSCSTCQYVRVLFFRIHNTRQTLSMLSQQVRQKILQPFLPPPPNSILALCHFLSILSIGKLQGRIGSWLNNQAFAIIYIYKTGD